MSITRRLFLQTTAAASVGVGAPAVAHALEADSNVTALPQASPALREAYDAWRQACADIAGTKQDLEWLVDEWRHLWPLAPEPIVWRVNPPRGEPTAERDLAGKRIYRDVAELRGRFVSFTKANNGRANFCVNTVEELTACLSMAKARKPKGRTASALEKNRNFLARYISDLETQLHHAQAYEAEKDRVRELSGVAEAKRKIADARNRASDAAATVGEMPAANATDIHLKAEVIIGEYERRFDDPAGLGMISDGYLLAQAVLAIAGRAQP